MATRGCLTNVRLSRLIRRKSRFLCLWSVCALSGERWPTALTSFARPQPTAYSSHAPRLIPSHARRCSLWRSRGLTSPMSREAKMTLMLPCASSMKVMQSRQPVTQQQQQIQPKDEDKKE